MAYAEAVTATPPAVTDEMVAEPAARTWTTPRWSS